MLIETDQSFLEGLCEAFGIDWKREPITGITIDANVGDAVRVTIRRYMENVEADGVCELASDYTLIPRKGSR